MNCFSRVLCRPSNFYLNILLFFLIQIYKWQHANVCMPRGPIRRKHFRVIWHGFLMQKNKKMLLFKDVTRVTSRRDILWHVTKLSRSITVMPYDAKSLYKKKILNVSCGVLIGKDFIWKVIFYSFYKKIHWFYPFELFSLVCHNITCLVLYLWLTEVTHDLYGASCS